ncbi:MAG: DUF362 domain-containing protein [Armatimonadota bacterium]|jgi:uncharacterized protein (DUF362 family)
MTHDEISRRDFLRRTAAAGLAVYGIGELAGLDGAAEAAGPPTIAVASKRSPAQLVQAAVDGLGGMKQFVKPGNTVVLKPNVAWARTPEQAATTNPEVVAEVVRLCKAAGAREIKVIDHSIDLDTAAFKMSGIQVAAEKAGAQVISARSQSMYQRVKLSRGKVLKSVDVLRDLMRADVCINLPIAKVHGSTKVTLGVKNMMGVVWDRGAWHESASLDQCIADFAAQFRPKLTILDGVRTLLTNGPKGPGRVGTPGVVVAGVDPVAVDAYGTTLLNFKPQDVGHIKLAFASGVGEMRLDRIKVKHV